MTISTLDELFVHSLKDVLYAERKILKALSKMERKATDPDLKSALTLHQDQTEEHVVRLEKVFDLLGRPARGVKCDAILGLLDEADSLMAVIDDFETMDAAVIALSHAIKHYEIARYSTLLAWAKQLGHPAPAALLKLTLDEENGADMALSKLVGQGLTATAAA